MLRSAVAQVSSSMEAASMATVVLPSRVLSADAATVASVMVMVWGVSQLEGEKLMESALREPSALLRPEMATVPVGSASRTTVNEEEVPASEVSRSEPSVSPVWEMVMPELSKMRTCPELGRKLSLLWAPIATLGPFPLRLNPCHLAVTSA